MEGINTVSKGLKQRISEIQGVTLWTKSFLHSPIPLLILDRGLRIIWRNIKFISLYGESKKIISLPIDKFFTNSLSRKKTMELYQNIKSSQYGYSWRINVEKKGIKQLSIISNLLILPIFNSPASITAPVAYACILDNVQQYLLFSYY